MAREGGAGIRRITFVLAALLLAGCGERWRPSAWLGAENPDASGRVIPFRLPAGYVAERVAGPDLITHPMFACFDDEGRLFVAVSTGHNLDGKALSQDPPDAIHCLEDTDDDGRFDKSTVFADRLTYPQGVLWHDGAVYTASPPSLWRLEDTDGDGVADRRQELATGFPFTGIADDLHGPTLGPDGRIYWGVGRFDYNIHRPGGDLIRRGRTPLIMRCLPDGDAMEVFSAAMGNPVEVAFSPAGEPFACGTFLSPESQGAGLRDAIVHCVYGGLYSVRDRDLSGETRTGELLPTLAQLGVAAGSGMMRARGGPLGDDRRLTLYSALFNMRSVARHALERDGATFRARREPFLESDVTDFHPTDVLEDADGSMLVVDTGGWFRSCPTSQIDKPAVTGGIYRVRRAGAPRVADPRGKKIGWRYQGVTELAALLEDPRFAVRDQAGVRLVRKGESAVRPLRELLDRGHPRARRLAVWVLSRIATDSARAAIRVALQDRNTGVRLAAVNASGLNRDGRAFDRLGEMVRTDTPPVRREAATALGRIDRPEAVALLQESLRSAGDRFLEHALIYAMIRLDERGATIAGLDDPSPAVRRGSLIALDQMAEGQLTLEEVRPLLDATDPDLRREALRVAARHPEWAGRMAETMRRWFGMTEDPAHPDDFRLQLLAFSRDPDIQAVIADAVARETTTVARRIRLLEVIAAAPGGSWPDLWVEALRKTLAAGDESVVRQAVSAIHVSERTDFKDSLIGLSRDESRGVDLRIEALDAVAPQLLALEPPLFEYLVARLGVDEPPLRKMAAARALARAPLDDGQLQALTGSIAQAGALVLPRLLPAFERSSNPRIGMSLVAALDKAPALLSLRPENVEQALRVYPAEIQQRAASLLHRLQLPEGDKASRLAEMQPILSGGDPVKGRDVFFGTRATCSTCHAIGSVGGHVGPDLSRIGAVRGGRDLLEAVLFPSASFARGYEPFSIATNDGRTYTGIIARETSDSIMMVTPDRLEVSVPRSTIEEIAQGQVSVMPRGLDANLTRPELADLFAFLRSLK